MVEVAEKIAATDECSHQREVMGKLVASRNSGNSESSQAGSRKWPHNFHLSPASVPQREKVHSIVRKVYGQSATDELNDFDVNNAVW